MSWSHLRRNSPTIHRFASLRHRQIRDFTSSAQSPQLFGSNFDQNSSSLLKWLSGIAITAGVAYGTFSYSSSAVSDDSVTDDHSPTRRFIFGDAFRKKIFFNYEKRIRMRSPPEKVFEYFASIKNPKGEVLMTPADLMRATVPVFPPSESHFVRDGYLRGERRPGDLRCDHSEFFMLFDMNNDGLISFKEYIFFVTLLSIPESSFSIAFKMFDIDGSGSLLMWIDDVDSAAAAA